MKTRLIDITSNNASSRQDIRVEFADRDKSKMFGPMTQITQVPGMRMFKEVTKFEARTPLEVGFTGLVDERLAILVDPEDNESLDKLVGLENFIGYYYHVLWRLTGDNIDKRPSVSLVFLTSPYDWKDNIPTAKNSKIAACLRWKNKMNGYIDIKIVSRGEWSAQPTDEIRKFKSTVISPLFFNNVGSLVHVDTTMTEFYETSVRTDVHAMNPITDIIYSHAKYGLLKDVDAIWISPTVDTILGKVLIGDLFQDKLLISSQKDVEFLMYHKKLDIVHDEKDHIVANNINRIAVIATSLRDFMTFEQDIVMASANVTNTANPMKIDLFVGYTPESADDQKLYEIENNLMNFIEDRAPVIKPTFYVSDLDAASLVDVPSRLLKYIPNNIEIYHSKIGDALC